MKRQYNFRIDDHTLESLKREAQYRGVKITDLIRGKLDNSVMLPEPVERFLDDYAKGLKRSRSQIIESIMINYMARRAALEDKTPSPFRKLDEFVNDEHGPILGKRLFDMLYGHYVNEIKKERAIQDLKI